MTDKPDTPKPQPKSKPASKKRTRTRPGKADREAKKQ